MDHFASDLPRSWGVTQELVIHFDTPSCQMLSRLFLITGRMVQALSHQESGQPERRGRAPGVSRTAPPFRFPDSGQVMGEKSELPAEGLRQGL